MMQAIWLEKSGPPEVLTLRSMAVPLLAREQVLIRTEAAGVIFGDVLERRGLGHPGSPKMPYVPGNEVAGIIEAVGSSVTDLAVGDRVVALMHEGGYATQVCADAWRCLRIPKQTDAVKAVFLLVNYWTAYYLLHHVLTPLAGQRVLVHGAAGGLGSALLQLGRLCGLELYGTASTTKQEVVRQNGATPIDYRTTDFVQRIQELTHDGVDVIYDTVGGANWGRSFRVLRRNGTLVICGIRPGARSGLVSLLPYALGMLPRVLLQRDRKVKIVFLSQDRLKDVYRQDLSILLDLLATGQIDPIIGATLPLNEASRAHILLEKSDVVGKIVLIPTVSKV